MGNILNKIQWNGDNNDIYVLIAEEDYNGSCFLKLIMPNGQKKITTDCLVLYSWLKECKNVPIKAHNMGIYCQHINDSMNEDMNDE